MATLSPEAKKKIEAAYAEFEKSIRKIAHEHRTTVGSLIGQVDAKYADKLKKDIQHRT
jgi:hypothetical protein